MLACCCINFGLCLAVVFLLQDGKTKDELLQLLRDQPDFLPGSFLTSVLTKKAAELGITVQIVFRPVQHPHLTSIETMWAFDDSVCRTHTKGTIGRTRELMFIAKRTWTTPKRALIFAKVCRKVRQARLAYAAGKDSDLILGDDAGRRTVRRHREYIYCVPKELSITEGLDTARSGLAPPATQLEHYVRALRFKSCCRLTKDGKSQQDMVDSKQKAVALGIQGGKKRGKDKKKKLSPLLKASAGEAVFMVRQDLLKKTTAVLKKAVETVESRHNVTALHQQGLRETALRCAKARRTQKLRSPVLSLDMSS